jgi:hypothetical protein
VSAAQTTEALKAAMEALEAKRREIAACAYCQENKGVMHPPHFASSRCESGKRNHCTCDICF